MAAPSPCPDLACRRCPREVSGKLSATNLACAGAERWLPIHPPNPSPSRSTRYLPCTSYDEPASRRAFWRARSTRTIALRRTMGQSSPDSIDLTSKSSGSSESTRSRGGLRTEASPPSRLGPRQAGRQLSRSRVAFGRSSRGSTGAFPFADRSPRGRRSRSGRYTDRSRKHLPNTPTRAGWRC